MAKLTDAQRRALQVLAEGERTGRRVQESNRTTPAGAPIYCTNAGCGRQVVRHGRGWRHRSTAPDGHQADPQPLTIYWQSRKWLERRRYIAVRSPHGRVTPLGCGGPVCALTDTGRQLAAEVGIS